MPDFPSSLRGAAAALVASLALTPEAPQWPEPYPVSPERVSVDDTGATERNGDSLRIEQQAVCVGARSWSAGDLGSTILYRSHRDGKKLRVGYFVYWSTERPWGNNALSLTLLPALATDAFYSHFLYVFPGAKDVLYGPADVEGVGVDFEEQGDGSLAVVGGNANDAIHDPVRLTPRDLVDAKGRVVLLTEVWSHQLGAHGGAEFSRTHEAELRCYRHASLRPMTDDVAAAFRLGDDSRPLRALPAW